MIRAIIFDYFGVVCSDEYWRSVSSDKNMTSDFHDLANSVNLGVLHWQDFVRQVADKTGRSTDEVSAMYETEQIHPELIAFIIQLKKTYKTALITNASHEFLQPRVEAAGLDKVFDEIVMSSRIGTIKPDPRIFEYTLDKLGVQPDEAVFIDDIPRNVDGALAVGMQGIVYQDFGQFKNDLNKLLSADTHH